MLVDKIHEKTIRLTCIYINVDGMHIWTAATIDNETEHSNMKCTRIRISLGTCAFCANTYNQWHILKMVTGRHHLSFSKITYKNKCMLDLSAVQFNSVNFVMCTAQSIWCESRWWWRDNENDIFLGQHIKLWFDLTKSNKQNYEYSPQIIEIQSSLSVLILTGLVRNRFCGFEIVLTELDLSAFLKITKQKRQMNTYLENFHTSFIWAVWPTFEIDIKSRFHVHFIIAAN